MAKKSANARAERAAALLKEQKRKERMRTGLTVGGVVLAIVVIVGGGFLIQSTRDTSGQAATAPAGLDQDSYSVVLGKASAPKTVAVYEDFQCPICQEFEKATKDKLRAAVDDGRVRLEYHMVAFLDRASTSKYSSRALNAAAVVLDTTGQDAFLKFHDLLYDNQPEEGGAGLSDDRLVAYAVEAGAQESDVRPGIEDNEFHQWAVNATDQMSKDGVTGTPTVFVDGEKGGDTLEDSIQAALTAAG